MGNPPSNTHIYTHARRLAVLSDCSYNSHWFYTVVVLNYFSVNLKNVFEFSASRLSLGAEFHSGESKMMSINVLFEQRGVEG